MTTLRNLTFAIVVTGCAYTGPGDAEIPEIPPAPAPMPAPCRAGEPGVVLCVDFEEVPLAERVIDSSPYQHEVVATQVTSESRLMDEQAVILKKESSLRVPESEMLDLPEFTIEMWIRPDAKPPRRGAGLFDQFGHYTMELQEDLRVECGLLLGDPNVRSDGRVLRDVWSHVVCRQAAGEMRVYLNGHLSGCRTLEAGGLPNLSQVGSAIGARFNLLGTGLVDRFIGGVDNVRIYKHGLTPDQICTAAGRAAGECETACPADEEED